MGGLCIGDPSDLGDCVGDPGKLPIGDCGPLCVDILSCSPSDCDAENIRDHGGLNYTRDHRRGRHRRSDLT